MSTNYPTSQSTAVADTAQHPDLHDANTALSDDAIENSEADYDDTENTEQQQDESIEASEPQYTTVKIDILGRAYNINCPVGEEDELTLATEDINAFLNDLRDKMPHIGYENLLVLCCLNLFNRAQQIDKDANASATANQATTEQARHLVDKMIEDMQFFKD